MDEGFPLQKANSKDRKWNITRELMINVVFHNIDSGMGVSLYADDGIMWTRGRNLEFITGKVQEASHEWVFTFSVDKTKAMFLTRKRTGKVIKLKSYKPYYLV